METQATANVAFLPQRTQEDAPLQRIPPHNFEVEMGLLAALLANNRAYEKVSELLRPEHFADARHGRIYDAIGKLAQKGQQANAATLKNYFEHDGELADIGGAEYLARLQASAVTIINAQDYAQRIFDLYLRRELIDIGTDVVNEAYAFDVDSDANAKIESAEQKLFDLAEKGQAEGGFKTFNSALTAAIDMATLAFKRDGAVTGVTTGFADMDDKLGGLHKSDLLIVAGRPSMGKTALATKLAFNAALARQQWIEQAMRDGRDLDDPEADGAVVAFFSLEMSAEQLANRLLSERVEIPSDKIRRGEVAGEDFPKFVQAAQELASLPLHIDDTPALSVSAVRTRARRLKRTHGLGLIVIDYLQLLSPPPGMRAEGRVQEISAITRGLKALAKELDVPVMALSQLSRAVEQREDKRPLLSDLRESGTIEQDADVVMFVYREEYYHSRAEPGRRPEEDESKFNERHQKWQERGEQIMNIAEVILGKQRHGPIGTVRLRFDGQFTKFSDLAPSDHLPEVYE
ncbi:MAG: replicative DNA helicase [Magnetospirillum sp.]|jgi:replicative DNA helicase|nr:replicative DNA helicase [Magnetospirillum sp.]